MIEANFLADDLDDRAAGARAAHGQSTTRRCGTRIQLADGRTITALDLQGEYLDRARKFVDDRQGDDADEQTRDVLDRWESVLTRLAERPDAAGRANSTGSPSCGCSNGYRDRDGLDWDSPRLQLVDLQYSDVRPEKGLYHRLVAARRDADAARPTAPRRPPSTRRRRTPARTSAASACAATAPSVAAASWDSVIFDVGRESLVRVPMLEPLRGTKTHVAELLDNSPDAQSLIDALVGPR